MKKWIWQHEDYPNFKYNKDKLTNLLNEIEYKRGINDCNLNKSPLTIDRLHGWYNFIYSLL